MAHNIWTDKAGKEHAAFAIEAAWHKLGVVLPNLMTAKEAMKAAGLDWEVEKRPLFWVDKNSEATETDAFGVFRNSDDEMLGVVTDFYKPIQNADGFKHVEILVEAVNGAHYSAAGALGKGEQVWCLAKIPLELRIKGTDDKSDTYLLFSTRHDGKGSAICKIVVTRVVCQNTFDMAMRENGSFFRVSHFGDVGKKMKAAQDLMKDVTGQLRSLEEKMNILAQRKMDKASFLAVMDNCSRRPKRNSRSGRHRRRQRTRPATTSWQRSRPVRVERQGSHPRDQGDGLQPAERGDRVHRPLCRDGRIARPLCDVRTGCRPEARGPRRDSGNDRRQSGHPAHRIEADEATGTGAEQDADRHRGRNVRRRDREGPQQASALELTLQPAAQSEMAARLSRSTMDRQEI